MPEVFKKSPLTEHIHRARMYAPNYHENYEKRTDGNEFNKKKQLCAEICEIQKTYGQSKYFRKLKWFIFSYPFAIYNISSFNQMYSYKKIIKAS